MKASSAVTGSRAPADAVHVVLYGAGQSIRLLLRRLRFSLRLVSGELGVRIYRKSGVRDPIATGSHVYADRNSGNFGIKDRTQPALRILKLMRRLPSCGCGSSFSGITL